MEKSAYKALPMQIIKEGTSYLPPGGGVPRLIKMDSPAVAVMTDLCQVPAATIRPDATAAQATQAMIARGVRLLLVVDAAGFVEGVITARDTMGEKPVKMLEEKGGKHAELNVADLMTPREKIEAIDMTNVLKSMVGHIVTTLRDSARQHALIVDRDPITGEQRIRGIFSATQIARQLGISIQTFEVSSTFAAIESGGARWEFGKQVVSKN
ncbi:CBS domain-containing protein [Sulfurisoma sediminicola]|uniref:CBS domain protein n=1 Tax=Sulfurisoma sediminicola TaxID=1381557 RepID=A0A497XB85_9PROT|nr:CBS domain-containing protein [Sulfurisoma sediminicola]RLJ63643.1 CBS domain protein [Sulfurisoma sediminicola]